MDEALKLFGPQKAAAAFVTGDALVIARSGSQEQLSPGEAEHAVLMYRAFCGLHGSERDEYRQQRSTRFQMTEAALSHHLLQHHSTADNSSDSASDSAMSSTMHGSGSGGGQQKPVNTNFFSMCVDERPLSDVIQHLKAGAMIIETTDRTIECIPVPYDLTRCSGVASGASSDVSSNPVGAAEAQLSRVAFHVSC